MFAVSVAVAPRRLAAGIGHHWRRHHHPGVRGTIAERTHALAGAAVAQSAGETRGIEIPLSYSDRHCSKIIVGLMVIISS